MAKPSVLHLEWARQGALVFYEIMINGISLRERIERHEGVGFGEGVSPIGLIEGAVERMLLTSPADLPDDRRSLLVCSMCFDLGCGAVCAQMARSGDQIVWEKMGIHDDNGIEPPHLFSKVRAFSFDWTQYREALTSRPDAPENDTADLDGDRKNGSHETPE